MKKIMFVVVNSGGVNKRVFLLCAKRFGGTRVKRAKRLKALEKKNTQLKKLVAELSLDNPHTQGSYPGNLQACPGD